MTSSAPKNAEMESGKLRNYVIMETKSGVFLNVFLMKDILVMEKLEQNQFVLRLVEMVLKGYLKNATMEIKLDVKMVVSLI
jgi:hypothetical protein